MKNIMFIAVFLMVLGTSAAMAQQTEGVDARQRVQRARIAQGVSSGEVTRSEARRLRAEQRHIRRVERRAKADGEVTRQEKAKITRKQNRASRDIRRQKHDGQDRGN
jgi:hypothetical protein